MQVTDGEGQVHLRRPRPAPTPCPLLPGFEEKKFAALTVPTTEELKVVMAIAALSESITVRANVPAPVSVPRETIGESKIEQEALSNVPLATERFEDALPAASRASSGSRRPHQHERRTSGSERGADERHQHDRPGDGSFRRPACRSKPLTASTSTPASTRPRSATPPAV
jgi:hypothetical protein